MQTLEKSKIELLKKKIKDDPESIAVMEELLFEYFGDPSLLSHPDRIKLIQNYIRRAPVANIAQSPIVQLDPKMSPEGYEVLEQEWLDIQGEHPDDPGIARSVANFYSCGKPGNAMDILHRCVLKNPDQQELWLDLGRYCMDAKERLGYFKEARKRGAEHPSLLAWIAKCSVEVKEYATVEAVGKELLAIVDEGRSRFGDKLDWAETGKEQWEKALVEAGSENAARDLVREISNFSFQKHWGHTALGHVAHNKGEIDVAIEHLRKSCEVGSDCRLSSYGPSLSLAGELCRVGAWQEVEQYLLKCSEFWENEYIEIWLMQIEQRELPDFIS